MIGGIVAEQQVQIEMKATDEELKGRYANALQVYSQGEEFFLDFLLIAPPTGQMVSRIVTSPGHMKRIAAAIDAQLKAYEQNFGQVDAAKAPEQGIGFKTS